jgi:hypothetical protein
MISQGLQKKRLFIVFILDNFGKDDYLLIKRR